MHRLVITKLKFSGIIISQVIMGTWMSQIILFSRSKGVMPPFMHNSSMLLEPWKLHNFTFPAYMETIQLIRKLPYFFMSAFHIFWKTLEVSPIRVQVFPDFLFIFQNNFALWFCLQIFTIDSFVLSYCNNIKCLKYIPNHLTFPDYVYN